MSAQEFAKTIQDNPKEIIAWAKREIKEYEKLIKILNKKIWETKKKPQKKLHKLDSKK